jgi:hypothetical protein
LVLAAFSPTIQLLAVAQRGTVRDDDAHAGVQRPAQAQRVAQVLAEADHRLLVAGMRDQRQAQARQPGVEAVAAWAGRIDVLRRWQPFDGACPARYGGVEPVQRAWIVGVHRGHPFEVRCVLGRQCGQVLVAGVVGRHLAHRHARVVARPVEGEEHGLEARGHGPALRQQALDEAQVDAPGPVVDARGIDVDLAAHVLPRVPQAAHARVEPQPAARVAVAEDVHVRVPHLRGIDPLPHAAHTRVIAQIRRQLGDALVEHAVAQRQVAAREQQAGGRAGPEQAAPA